MIVPVNTGLFQPILQILSLFSSRFLVPFFPFPLLITVETNPCCALSYEEENKRGQGDDEDAPLVSSAQDGDTKAFEGLVRKYQNRTMNIAFRMTGDYEDACEIVQETFLSAFKAIGKFRGEARFSTWIYGICLNHARNRLKQKRGRARHEAYSLDDPPKDGEGDASRVVRSAEPSIVDQLERKELQNKIQMCIQALDEQYREVLVLRDVEGFAYEEIHNLLGIPEGTIKSRLFRARDALRTNLKRLIGDY
jgi:RNA polymerase sigma-70 factor (ECF subfamily)